MVVCAALGCVHPPAGWALHEAERCLAAGLHGLGELAFYDTDLDNASLDPVCRLCAEADRPLLLHTNEPVGHQYPGKAPMTLAALYALVGAHPATRLVLAHMGGGLFFYSLMKKEVSQVLANVWLDTAAAPFLYRPRAYALAVELLGAGQAAHGLGLSPAAGQPLSARGGRAGGGAFPRDSARSDGAERPQGYPLRGAGRIMGQTAILHAADLHLDGPVAVLGPAAAEPAGAARRVALGRLVELAGRARAKVVILAGDVFHTPRPPLSAVLALEDALAAWTRQGAPGLHRPGQPRPVFP